MPNAIYEPRHSARGRRRSAALALAGRARLATSDVGALALVALGAVTALTGIMFVFRAQLGVLNVLLLYLLLTFFLALSGGLWPAVLSAVLGFLAFDFFFIPPFHTLDVAAPDHVLALFVYLGVAVVTAHLVSGMRARTEQALRESRRMALLAELNAALIGDVTLDAILARIAERIVTVYGAQGCRVLVRGEDEELRTAAFFPEQIGPNVDRTGLLAGGMGGGEPNPGRP